MTTNARLWLSAVALLLPLRVWPQAHTFEANYQQPPSGARVAVSAPDPTSTPIIIEIVIDGKSSTAAVLAKGWYRYKAVIVDGARHEKIARNPKAREIPWQAEFLVPVDGKIVLVARSHAAAVRTGGVRTCTVPFDFRPRQGFRYSAVWKMSEKGCSFGINEIAESPADAPEVPLGTIDATVQDS